MEQGCQSRGSLVRAGLGVVKATALLPSHRDCTCGGLPYLPSTRPSSEFPGPLGPCLLLALPTSQRGFSLHGLTGWPADQYAPHHGGFSLYFVGVPWYEFGQEQDSDCHRILEVLRS